MPELYIVTMIAGPAFLMGGGASVYTGDYVSGSILILIGLFFTWAFHWAHKPMTYPHTIKNCPNKGKTPVYGMFRDGYHWYKYSVGEDDNTMVTCTTCGYTNPHAHINPLEQVESELLGSQGHPELLPTHP